METIKYLIVPAVVLAFCVGYEVGFRRALYWVVRTFNARRQIKSG